MAVKKLVLWPLMGILLVVVGAFIAVQLASGRQNLSPEEVATREAEHRQQWVQSEQLLSQWLKEFSSSGVDPKALKKTDVHVEPVRPPATLQDAVDAADVIAAGTVVAVEYENVSTLFRVRIEEVVKGQPEAEILVAVVGGPRSASGTFERFDQADVILTESPATPLPFLGDRVLFFLEAVEASPNAPSPTFQERYGADRIYRPLSYIGVNQVANDRVAANPHSDYRDEVHGLTEAEAIEKLRRLLEN